MKFPDRPTCHDGDSRISPPFRPHETTWREPFGRREPYQCDYRTCSFCGSIHPEDLIKYLKEGGATMHGSDWKYGYPHKFYVEIPNPIAGQTVQVGSTSRWDETKNERVSEPIMGAAPEKVTAKWYNDHLDDELDDETFIALTKLLWERTGVLFTREDGQIKYSAPYRGYQKP